MTLSVRDIEQSTAWYASKLRFHEVGRKEYLEFHTRLRFLELNGWRVELIEDKGARAVERRPDPPQHTALLGASQFCLETDDLEAVKRSLATAGVPITWEFQNVDLRVHFVFIRDPDGNLIQYLQRL